MDSLLTPSEPGENPRKRKLSSVHHPKTTKKQRMEGGSSQQLSDVELLATLRVPLDQMLSSLFRYPECQNIVSNVEWRVTINLQQIPENYACPEYTPKKFAAPRVRLARPATTALIFKNGKVVCVGATTQECARLACQKHRRLISRLGYRTHFQMFRIQNRVYTVRVEHPISLVEISKDSELLQPGNQLAAQWQPGNFPGLIYKMRNPDVKLAIFDSGKVNMTGVKSPEDAIKVWNQIFPVLTKLRDDSLPAQSDNRYAYRMSKKLS